MSREKPCGGIEQDDEKEGEFRRFYAEDQLRWHGLLEGEEACEQ